MDNNQLIPGELFYEDDYNDADWPPKISRESRAWNSPWPTTQRDCLSGFF